MHLMLWLPRDMFSTDKDYHPQLLTDLGKWDIYMCNVTGIFLQEHMPVM